MNEKSLLVVLFIILDEQVEMEEAYGRDKRGKGERTYCQINTFGAILVLTFHCIFSQSLMGPLGMVLLTSHEGKTTILLGFTQTGPMLY